MGILGISGSLRADSLNTALLRAAARELPGGVRFHLLEGLKDVPAYDQDDDGASPPPAVVRLRDEIARADALLISTPEYNGSIPGGLKNALDWASRPRSSSSLLFKPVAVMGATPGSFGAVWAQADLRKVLAASGARVVDGEVALAHADQAFAQDGGLVDEAIRDQMRELVHVLVDAAAPERVAA
jgi:chromate reductase